MEQKDRIGINLALKRFKAHSGVVNFPALLSIPTAERLPQIASNDPTGALGMVAAGVTLAFEAMNLARPMKPGQIIDLADAVLDSSAEDNLSLEDLMLFLQKLVRGEYGVLYESMDIPKFMEKFEHYRQERHEAMVNLRDEQAAQHRAILSTERLKDMFPMDERQKQMRAQIEYLVEKTKAG